MSISVLVIMDVSFVTVSLDVKCFTIGDLGVSVSVLKTTLKALITLIFIQFEDILVK